MLLKLGPKIRKGHFVDVYIFRVVVGNVAVCINMPVHGGVLPAGFQKQRKVIGECAEVGEYQTDAGKTGAVFHSGPPCNILGSFVQYNIRMGQVQGSFRTPFLQLILEIYGALGYNKLNYYLLS